MDQRREAGADINGRVSVAGEEVLVAPEAGRAALDGLAAGVLLDPVVVIDDFDRAETEFADMGSFERVFALTLATAKAGCVTHASLLTPSVSMFRTGGRRRGVGRADGLFGVRAPSQRG